MRLLAALALMTLAACGHVQPDLDSRNEARDRRAEEFLRDPLKRQAAMDNMQRQIFYQVRTVTPERYQLSLRPRLMQQLVATGLDASDAQQVLRDVDYHLGLHDGSNRDDRLEMRTARR